MTSFLAPDSCSLVQGWQQKAHCSRFANNSLALVYVWAIPDACHFHGVARVVVDGNWIRPQLDCALWTLPALEVSGRKSVVARLSLGCAWHRSRDNGRTTLL